MIIVTSCSCINASARRTAIVSSPLMVIFIG
jgi:hypothetical protein